jgi:hypothetical protein
MLGPTEKPTHKSPENKSEASGAKASKETGKKAQKSMRWPSDFPAKH